MNPFTRSAARPGEAERLARLRLLDATNATDDDTIGRVVRTAARLAQTPCAAVNIIDDTLQTSIAAVGVEAGTHPVNDALCSIAVQQNAPVATGDVASDPSMAFSSFADGSIGMYVAVPLASPVGAFGSLCVWDPAPRTPPDGLVAALADLAGVVTAALEARLASRELAHQASTDPLTGVPNRRMFIEHTGYLLATAQRTGAWPTVLMIDLNDFKPINDTHGHRVGDEVLREVAVRMTSIVRDGELLARVGGDEFAVVGHTGLASPNALVRYRGVFAKPFGMAGRQVSLSAAIGVATAVADDAPAELLERADRAMYEVKRAG